MSYLDEHGPAQVGAAEVGQHEVEGWVGGGLGVADGGDDHQVGQDAGQGHCHVRHHDRAA